MANLTPKRIKELREQDDGSIALVLYLDLEEKEAEEWREHCHTELACDREISTAVIALLSALDSGDAVGLDDEAARAISLFVALGPDRQAWLVELVESALNTKPCHGEPEGTPDPLAGQNASDTWKRNVRRYGVKEADAIMDEATADSDELDAAAAVEAVTQLFSQGNPS